jgi:hypothetical protein
MASDFETLVDAVRTALADDTIDFGLFRLAEAEKASPRRVVWIPTDFHCEPPMMANSLIDSDSGEIGDTMFTDFLSVECHIVGVDFADCCAIRVQVVNAVHTALGTASRAQDGAYITEQQGQAGLLWGGRAKCMQRFTWRMNVTRLHPGAGQVRVTKIEIPPGIQPDGSVGPSDSLVTTETATLDIT